jgi:hypothetical protein
VLARGVLRPGRFASQGLKFSMCRRVTRSIEVTSGAASRRNPAKARNAWSVLTTLPGRSTHPICIR